MLPIIKRLPSAARRPRRRLRLFFMTITLLLATIAIAGASLMSTPPQEEVVKLRTLWSAEGVHPGGSVVLGVVIDIADGFHINADPAQLVIPEGFSPYPTRVSVKAADATLTPQAPRFPPAHPVKLDFSDVPLMFFDRQAVVYLPVRVSPNATPGNHRLELLMAYQACDKQTCLLPRKISLSVQLPVVSPGTPLAPVAPELFAAFTDGTPVSEAETVRFNPFGVTFSIDVSSALGLAVLLFTAAFGGALLNFTPCVLPLIPIKIMALANLAGNRGRCLVLGVAMCAGVVGFWLFLGGLIATVSGFTATNQLFQYPVFTITVGLFIALMAVGMCGLFHVRLPAFVYRFNPGQETLAGSFGLGILTAILSTPCTAPFMGAAAAWAATQPPATTLATFAVIGGGMALPYLILSAAPGMVRKMPRTGPASELIKQIMGLLMLAAAAYFIGSGLSALLATPPTPPSRAYWWVVMGFSAAAGGWLLVRTLRITAAKHPRALFGTLGMLVVLLSILGGFRLSRNGAIDWVYYTPERFSAAHQSGQTVVMLFTAEWCLNCKALEQGVLNRPDVARRLSADDITPIKVDITGTNPAGKTRLKETGTLTIPLLIIYAPDGREAFRSHFYTAQQLLAALDGAQK